MRCKKCGVEIDEGARFCGSCGTKVDIDNNTSEKVNMAINNNDTEKYTGNELLEKIGKLITGGLSIISGIMVIGALFGFFDKNPVPFIIFIVIVILFGKLEDKMPKVPTIMIAVLEIIALIFCFNVANNVEAVASVKGGSPSNYPSITYEKAFDNYFSEPTWKSAGKDEDGNEIVRFTGNCYYLGDDAVAEVKFTIYEEQGSFVVSSVKINGQDMGLLGNGLIVSVFEDYKQSH